MKANLRKGLLSIIFLLMLTIGSQVVNAPCGAYAQGGAPPQPLGQRGRPLDQVAVERLPAVDVQALLSEDAQNAGQGPFRFAKAIPVEITPTTHGTTEMLDSDTWLWRLRIQSPDAVSLNLGFTRYFMPPGGQLFLYTPDYQTVIGPFTEEDNEEHGQLWTPILTGDETVVEVSLPASLVPQLELELTSVNHAYQSFPPKYKSAACHIDVACPEGDP